MVHAVLSDDRKRLILDPQWDEKQILDAVPGISYIGRTKTWSLPLTWASMITMRGVFSQRFTYGEDVADWTRDVIRYRIDPSLVLRQRTELDVNPDDDLMPFQSVGVEWMRTSGSGLLGDDLGVGKTPQALAFLNDRLPALVVSPNSVKYHWAARSPRWAPNATPYVIDGAMTKRRKILDTAKDDPSALVIINYEAARQFSRLAPYGSIRLKRCTVCDPKYGDETLKPTQCQVHPKELNGFGFRTVILDEGHNVGTPESQQTRAVWAICHDPLVQYRWVLTGTPDNMTRLWSMMHAVAPDEYPTRSKFMERYALSIWNAYGGHDVIGIRPDTREEMQRILDPRFRRMIKSVVLPQLPPIIRQIRVAAMTPAMTKAYEELKIELRTTLADGTRYLVANKLVAQTRLLQWAAGTIHVDKVDPDDLSTWKVTITDPSPKLDVLEEVLDDLHWEDRFTVGCVHVDVVKMASERLGKRNISHAVIDGRAHPQMREQACQDLKDGKIRAIVYVIKAGGVGLDMSGAGIEIFLQRSWSFIDNTQAEARSHRVGAEGYDSIRIIDIVTGGTVEEDQIEKLHWKLEKCQEIVRDREQIYDRLTRVFPGDEPEFSSLIAHLDDLNRSYAEIMTDSEPVEIENVRK